MVPDISVVIPLRHEAPKLAELCRQLKQALDPSARAWDGVIAALVLV